MELISWDVAMALCKYPSWVVQDRTLFISKYFCRNTSNAKISNDFAKQFSINCALKTKDKSIFSSVNL